MINVNSVMSSLYTTISSNATLVNSNVTVCLNEVFNTDPNLTPWVGIYYNGSGIEPRRIGASNPWRASYDMRVYVQESSHESGEKANDLLDRLTFPVLAAVNSNKNLDNSVNIITDIAVDPFDRDIQDEIWMFTNEITINAEGDV